MTLRNRQWLLARRPDGLLQADDLTYRETELTPTPLEPGQIRIRNRVFQCAPTMRNWMEAEGSGPYPSIPIGAPIMAPAGAEVIESRHDSFPVGSRLSLIGSWQDYETLDPDRSASLQRLPETVDLIDALGRFGLNSLTAYFGMLRVAQPQKGQTVLVSGAAGSTGSIAAQIGMIMGCRVIGTAGGPEKCAWLTEELGLDGAIDYRTQNLPDALAQAAPDGIDIFFDNVGGPILQAAIANMRRLGCIVLCGQISGYNDVRGATASLDMMRLIYRSVRMQGFLMGDYRDEVEQAVEGLQNWSRAGRLQFRVDVREGFDDLPNNFNLLFSGANEGTLLNKI